MADSSLDTNDSSLATSSRTPTGSSDDEDDELLALRIAALESIKVKEAKAEAANNRKKFESEAPPRKPEFIIKSHNRNKNLLSIVTCEQEIEKTIAPKPKSPQKKDDPPAVLPPPEFDASRPPPGYLGPRYTVSPPPRWSRSPERRGRCRSRSPLPPRRFSRSPLSPYRGRPRRSRSPPPRRSHSPLRRRRSRTPNGYRYSPPPRRQRYRSPVRKTRTPSPASEWETDTEDEKEEQSSVVKEENANNVPDNKLKAEPLVKSEDDPDASVDDVLKLDASAEVDEFSAFLNEFEDEVLSEKKTQVKKEKEETLVEEKKRPEYEKKTIDGKRLRKKIVKKQQSPDRRRKSNSPRRLQRSPGRRFFSPGRRVNKSYSPDSRRTKSPLKNPKRNSKTPPLDDKRKSRDKSSNSTKEQLKETSEERQVKEEKEYQERLSKLPSPERERMEARRKKFQKAVPEIEGSKKISLKSSTTEKPVHLDNNRNRKRIESHTDDDSFALNADIGDTLDMFDEEVGQSKENSPPQKKNVTDLRVQLHKKRQAQENTKPAPTVKSDKSTPLLRSVSPGEIDSDEIGPVEPSKRRKVVPPGKALKSVSAQDSDRSPSPPPTKKNKKRRSSEEDLAGLSDRRILVVKEESNETPDVPVSAKSASSPKKGLKKSLNERLGDKIQANQFTEEEIYNEMLRQQKKNKASLEKRELKRLRKELRRKEEKLNKKEEKLAKKKKKSKKDRKSDPRDSDNEDLSDDDFKALADIPAEDSDEELFRFFEDDAPKDSERKRNSSGKSKTSSKSSSRGRWSSGDKSSGEKERKEVKDKESRGERAKVKKSNKLALEDLEYDLLKLQETTDEESLDLLEKMRKKNQKRLKRMKEIERDKILFA